MSNAEKVNQRLIKEISATEHKLKKINDIN